MFLLTACQPCSTAPLQWFRRYRGLATGIVFGGGSLGAAVMGVAANELVNKVGIEWTFRILGFMLWAVCLPAAYCIKQPLLSKSAVPQLQWYARSRVGKHDYFLIQLTWWIGIDGGSPSLSFSSSAAPLRASLSLSRRTLFPFSPGQSAALAQPPSLPLRYGISHPHLVACLPGILPMRSLDHLTVSIFRSCSAA